LSHTYNYGDTLARIADKRLNSPLALSYTDKAGWLEAAVCEEVLGNSWFNLIQEMFDHIGLKNSYPSVDGNAQFAGQADGTFRTIMKGHNANPIEVPGLAVAYTRGPANPDGSGLGLYLEPEQSQESGYAIGCAVMSAEDLATWGKEIRKSYWTEGGYLPPEVTQELFTVQTGAADKATPYGGLQTVNWGLGIAKMVPVTDSDGAELATWGMVGAGGFGGYAGGIIIIPEADVVIAATSNTGIQPFGGTLRDIAADYAANFL
jgi:CubicO group peptidase (beta-lactamase class C family)